MPAAAPSPPPAVPLRDMLDAVRIEAAQMEARERAFAERGLEGFPSVGRSEALRAVERLLLAIQSHEGEFRRFFAGLRRGRGPGADGA